MDVPKAVLEVTDISERDQNHPLLGEDFEKARSMWLWKKL